jgi:hypothetical protein
MATQARPSPIAANLDAMGKTLDQRLKEAQAKGDTKEVERLTFAAGLQSAAVGLVTGVPDLAIAAYDWVGTPTNTKDLRTRILEANGIPTKAPNAKDQFSYDLPEYATMAWGLKSLAQSGWQGYKGLKESRKLAEFTNKLPETQANRFKRFMMNGQGSNDPMVMAALNQMRRDPTYAELFTKMDEAAVATALKAMSPRPSRLAPQSATTKAVESVEEKINKVRKARDAAGNVNFTRAAALSGEREIVNPSNTVQALSELRNRYAKVGTTSAQNMVNTIDELSNTFIDTATGTPKNMTSGQFQGLVTEFGRKVGTEDSVVKGLAQKDLEILNNSVFSSLSKDLTASLKTAANVDDKKALGALIQARTQYAKGSAEYNKFISQGIPKFLQSKTIDEIDPEMLFSEYKKLNPAQRGLFRDWLGDRSKESLQFLDKKAFDNFLGKSFKDLPDGTLGYDLGKMAKNWETLKKTKPDEADMLMKALGTNSTEFDGRMKDALVFSRKMDVGAVTKGGESKGVIERLGKVLPGVVGSSSAGYQGAQVTDLGLQSAELIFANKGLSSQQVMKALLTKEGADFLKKASLSPNSRETLDALVGMEGVDLKGLSRNYLATGALSGPIQATASGMAGIAEQNVTPTPTQAPAVMDDGLNDPDLVEPSSPASEMQMDDDGLIDPDASPMSRTPQETPMQSESFMPASSQGLPQEEAQFIQNVLAGMKQDDPLLDTDYMYNAYLQATPEQRRQAIMKYRQ